MDKKTTIWSQVLLISYKERKNSKKRKQKWIETNIDDAIQAAKELKKESYIHLWEYQTDNGLASFNMLRYCAVINWQVIYPNAL